MVTFIITSRRHSSLIALGRLEAKLREMAESDFMAEIESIVIEDGRIK